MPELPQEDLHAVVKNCRAVVNSSVSEGMSAAILEVTPPQALKWGSGEGAAAPTGLILEAGGSAFVNSDSGTQGVEYWGVPGSPWDGPPCPWICAKVLLAKMHFLLI